MVVQAFSTGLDALGAKAAVRLAPRIPLSHREFAEKYIRLATGPLKGEPFRVANQPFTGLLFHELDSGKWPEVYATGPSQSSKTLSCFVIPTLRTVCELREDALIGVPEADMAADKWDKDFLPTLKASPDLTWLIPREGPGSRGGRIRDRITLGSGVDIKIMSRGGQDTNKAGYTAPRICVTELKGFGGRSETSTEADDLKKIKARQRAFRRSERQLLGEGTLGEPHELPWTLRGDDEDETIISTRSRIVSPCPHCGGHIAPTREHLLGWQDAESEWQVQDQAFFACPKCGKAINDLQRRQSMAECVLVHWGQTVDRNGRVHGDPPPTSTLWFHWWCWHNLLLDAADTAVDEWKAAQLDEGTVERENAERELCQFAHAVPFRSKLAENEMLSAQSVRKRTDEWQAGLLPADTVKLLIGVDIGDWTAWWVALALRSNGCLHIPAYGAFDVKRTKDDEASTRVVDALIEFNQTVVEAGFAVESSDGLRLPDGVGVDLGHMPDDVAKAIRSFGRGWGNRWKGLRGRGASKRRAGKVAGGYNHPTRVSMQRPKIGTEWFADLNVKRGIPEITFNADYWLLHMQDRLRAKRGSKGALTLFRPDFPKQHDRLTNHLTAEHLKREWDPTKGGLVEKWIVNGQNHLGDALKMALVMGDVHGYRLRDIPREEAEPLPAVENWYAGLAR
jgi:predicted RNA-binding Zn-ribbon protein involved in translation (DUF1610 family)